MARSTAQIIKSINSFAQTGDKLWSTASRLTIETVAHAQKHGETSLVVQLDSVLPNVNRNIHKAFRAVVQELTAITLKAELDDENHGKVSKNKAKKLAKKRVAAEQHWEALRVGEGEALKCWLGRDKKPGKDKAAPTVSRAITNAANIFESENCERTTEDLQAAIAAIDLLRKSLSTQVALNLGIADGVEKTEEAEKAEAGTGDVARALEEAQADVA
jgi:hypothetical protein